MFTSGVTAARPEAIFDEQPFPKPSHSIQLFLLLPLLLLLHLLHLTILLPFTTSSQPSSWNLNSEGNGAAELFSIPGNVGG